MCVQLGQTRGLGLRLDIVARVLRIEHVEQGTSSDVELLAIGQQKIIRYPTLGFQFSRQAGLVCQPAPRRSGIFLGAAGLFEHPGMRLIRTCLLFANIVDVGRAVEHQPPHHHSRLKVGGLAAETVNVVTDPGGSLKIDSRPQFGTSGARYFASCRQIGKRFLDARIIGARRSFGFLQRGRKILRQIGRHRHAVDRNPGERLELDRRGVEIFARFRQSGTRRLQPLFGLLLVGDADRPF